jgi:hypothetical protein
MASRKYHGWQHLQEESPGEKSEGGRPEEDRNPKSEMPNINPDKQHRDLGGIQIPERTKHQNQTGVGGHWSLKFGDCLSVACWNLQVLSAFHLRPSGLPSVQRMHIAF